MKRFLPLIMLWLTVQPKLPAQEPAGIVINPDGSAYDSETSVTADGKGASWIAWHAYFEGKEKIQARRVADGDLGPLHTVQEKGTIHSSPQIVAHGGSVWVLWASKLEGRWQIIGRDTPNKDGKGNIALKANGTRPIIMATLYGDGKEIKTYMGNGRELTVNHRLQGLKKGTHWYYWRIVQEGVSPQYPGNVKVARGNLAWSSPHWVVVE